MLYFVAAVNTRNVVHELGEKSLEIEPVYKPALAYGPDAFVAESAESAKQKALIRWGVAEGELDSLEVYTLPFQKS